MKTKIIKLLRTLRLLLKIQVFGSMLSLICVLCSGCASTSGYLKDRCRDGADIFTCSVGVGLGAKVRVGPVGTGLMVQHEMAGLRRGTIGIYDQSGNLNRAFPWVDYVALCVGGETCNGAFYDLDPRGKSFLASMDIPFVYRLEDVCNVKHNESRYPFYTQIEAVLALGPSLRLGFNPGELLDFILGWTTLDIFGDDLARKRNGLPAGG